MKSIAASKRRWICEPRLSRPRDGPARCLRRRIAPRRASPLRQSARALIAFLVVVAAGFTALAETRMALPTRKREPRQARKGATVTWKGVAGPFAFCRGRFSRLALAGI